MDDCDSEPVSDSRLGKLEAYRRALEAIRDLSQRFGYLRADGPAYEAVRIAKEVLE